MVQLLLVGENCHCHWWERSMGQGFDLATAASALPVGKASLSARNKSETDAFFFYCARQALKGGGITTLRSLREIWNTIGPSSWGG